MIKIIDKGNKIFWAVVLGIFIGLATAIAFVYTGVYLELGSDMFYYLSIADSLLSSGHFYDLTSVNISPVLTPQNGLPILLAFLKFFGVGNYSALIIILFLNFILWVFSASIYYKMIKIANLKDKRLEILLILGFLSGMSLLRYQLAPITDGIYNAGSLLLTYLLYKNILINSSKDYRSIVNKCLPALILSIILVHFSVRVFVFLLAAFLVPLFTKSENKIRTMVCMSVFIILTLLSQQALLFFMDTSLIGSMGSTYFTAIISNILNVWQVIPFYVFFGPQLTGVLVQPFSLFGVCLITVTTLFMLFIAYCFYYGSRKRDTFTTFSALIVIIFIMAIISLPSVKVLNEAGVRYMLASLPIFYILAAKFRYTKYVISLAILLSIIHSVSFIIATDKIKNPPSLIRVMYDNGAVLPKDALLISAMDRIPYVLIEGKDSNDVFCSIDLNGKNRLWIIGSQEYRDLQLQRFLYCHDKVDIKSTNLLTSDYGDKYGNALVEYNFQQNQ